MFLGPRDGLCRGKPAKKKQKRLAETTQKLKDKERDEKDKRRENKDKDLRLELRRSSLEAGTRRMYAHDHIRYEMHIINTLINIQ